MELTTTPAQLRWTHHLDTCAQCRTMQAARALCPTGYRLLMSAQEADDGGQLPPQTDLDWRLVALAGAGTTMLILVCLGVILLLAGCGPAPVEAAARPELVRVIVQTERSIQVQHDDDRIEVVSAAGWASLQTPVVVCVAFEGRADTSAPRLARLQERSACR